MYAQSGSGDPFKMTILNRQVFPPQNQRVTSWLQEQALCSVNLLLGPPRTCYAIFRKKMATVGLNRLLIYYALTFFIKIYKLVEDTLLNLHICIMLFIDT